MESVWLLLGSGPRRWSVDPFGFLGRSLFRCENPRFELLDLFGFPWILSSGSRLFNGLREISAEKFFAPLFPLGSASPCREAAVLAWEMRAWSYRELSLISDYPQ
jgi:hypothetical protein